MQFLAARVQRLAPLYLLGALWGGACAFVLAWYGVGQSHVGLKLLLALSFAPLLFGAGPIYPLNAPSWSLFDEFVVNARLRLCRADAQRRAALKLRSARRFSLSASRRSFAGSFAAVGGAEAYGLAGRHPSRGLQLSAWGCCCIAGIWRAVCRNRTVSAWLVAAIVFGSFFVPVETPLYDLALVGLLYPGLIVVALANEPRGELPVRLFDLAGLISYPLYVLHWPLAQLLRAATADSVGLGAGLGFLAVGPSFWPISRRVSGIRRCGPGCGDVRSRRRNEAVSAALSEERGKSGFGPCGAANSPL